MKKQNIRNIVRKVLSEGEIPLREPGPVDHHYPRADWDGPTADLADKWADMMIKSFEPERSNTKDGELSQKEAKEWWADQVEAAMIDLENDLVQNIRKIAMTLMQATEEKLIDGQYS